MPPSKKPSNILKSAVDQFHQFQSPPLLASCNLGQKWVTRTNTMHFESLVFPQKQVQGKKWFSAEKSGTGFISSYGFYPLSCVSWNESQIILGWKPLCVRDGSNTEGVKRQRVDSSHSPSRWPHINWLRWESVSEWHWKWVCCGQPFPCIEPSYSGTGKCGQKQHRTCWSEQLVCDSDFDGHLDDSEVYSHPAQVKNYIERDQWHVRHKLFGAGGILILKNLQSKESLWNVYKSFQKCPVCLQ